MSRLLAITLGMLFSVAAFSNDHSEYFFDVKFKLLKFNPEQSAKVERAAELIKQVVTSSAFKQRILNHVYKGKKTFVDNLGLTNLQIYKKILAASERLSGLGNNQTMDLELELYYDGSSTIGYTYPHINRIYMNTRYFNQFLPYQITDNMFHEWLHKIGFDHDVKRTPERSFSVPYAVGYIMKSLAQEIP